jgi:two-component system nitrate/nitrite sensor histidine kinase NarX
VTHHIQVRDNFFTPTEEVQLFGIIQEAFANIRKHAQARHVSIQLTTRETGNWLLVIEDDGVGIAKESQDSKKYGLSMMRDRAKQLQADIQIAKGAEGGTIIRLESRKGGGYL